MPGQMDGDPLETLRVGLSDQCGGEHWAVKGMERGMSGNRTSCMAAQARDCQHWPMMIRWEVRILGALAAEAAYPPSSLDSEEASLTLKMPSMRLDCRQQSLRGEEQQVKMP